MLLVAVYSMPRDNGHVRVPGWNFRARSSGVSCPRAADDHLGFSWGRGGGLGTPRIGHRPQQPSMELSLFSVPRSPPCFMSDAVLISFLSRMRTVDLVGSSVPGGLHLLGEGQRGIWRREALTRLPHPPLAFLTHRRAGGSWRRTCVSEAREPADQAHSSHVGTE